MNHTERLIHKLWATVVLSALLLAVALAMGSVNAQEAARAGATGTVNYISGGVGKEEADAMKRASADYSLTVELAVTEHSLHDNAPKSYFISGVAVNIRDAAGNSIVNTTTDGPFLLAQLPEGHYTIDTEWNGIRKSATVAVDAHSRRHLMFNYVAD